MTGAEIYSAGLRLIEAGVTVDRASIFVYDPDQLFEIAELLDLVPERAGPVDRYVRWSIEHEGITIRALLDAEEEARLIALLPTHEGEAK